MKEAGYYERLLKDVLKVVSKIETAEFEKFVSILKTARRIYVMGAGRSGLVGKAFAMRLVHLRKRTFVVGETVVPAIRARTDLLVAVSGSGRTPSVVEIAKTAKGVGAKVVAVTGTSTSPLSSWADLTILIPMPAKRARVTSYDARQLLGRPMVAPLGSLFELSALVFFERIIAQLMEELKISEDEMRKEHTVLE